MLDKTLFDCNDIGDFYDCGCEDHEEGETGTGTGMGTGEARSQSQSTDQREDHDTSPLVEISREP